MTTSENVEKKKGHFLDLKLPIGGLFLFYGVVLIVHGLFSDKAAYARSLGINVNLIWGGALAVFGAVFLLLALLKQKDAR